MTEALLVTLGALMIAATLLPLLKLDDWWVRIFDFPRLQITVLLALTFVAYLLVRENPGPADNLFLGALTACLLYQTARMVPYTVLWRKQVQGSRRADPSTSACLLFANVLMTNRDATRLRRLIDAHDPDVVLAVEADRWWQQQLDFLRHTHHHTVLQPQDNTYGMLLYSRLALRDATVKFLVQDDVPSIHARLVLRCGQELALRCLHPRPPAPKEDKRSTERDAELLLVGKEVRSLNVPAIVMGDLNDVAWSHTNRVFRDISGLLDPRIGRGFFHTFNAKWPLIRFPLDHFFHSPHFRLLDFRRLPKIGSDHFPVCIKLSFEPDAVAQQDHLRASAHEHEEANEKIEKIEKA